MNVTQPQQLKRSCKVRPQSPRHAAFPLAAFVLRFVSKYPSARGKVPLEFLLTLLTRGSSIALKRQVSLKSCEAEGNS